jgi:hypothetical protein
MLSSVICNLIIMNNITIYSLCPFLVNKYIRVELSPNNAKILKYNEFALGCYIVVFTYYLNIYLTYQKYVYHFL